VSATPIAGFADIEYITPADPTAAPTTAKALKVAVVPEATATSAYKFRVKALATMGKERFASAYFTVTVPKIPAAPTAPKYDVRQTP
jgi:hypothetical protein